MKGRAGVTGPMNVTIDHHRSRTVGVQWWSRDVHTHRSDRNRSVIMHSKQGVPSAAAKKSRTGRLQSQSTIGKTRDGSNKRSDTIDESKQRQRLKPGKTNEIKNKRADITDESHYVPRSQPTAEKPSNKRTYTTGTESYKTGPSKKNTKTADPQKLKREHTKVAQPNQVTKTSTQSRNEKATSENAKKTTEAIRKEIKNSNNKNNKGAGEATLKHKTKHKPEEKQRSSHNAAISDSPKLQQPETGDYDAEYYDDFENDDDSYSEETTDYSEDSATEEERTYTGSRSSSGSDYTPPNTSSNRLEKTQSTTRNNRAGTNNKEKFSSIFPSQPSHSDQSTVTNSQSEAPSGINFEKALKRQRLQRSATARRSRGATLLSLIQLQRQSIDILLTAPATAQGAAVSWPGASARFGANSATQTGADKLEESMQTDPPVTRSAWTQQPVAFDIRVQFDKHGQLARVPSVADFRGCGDQFPSPPPSTITAARSGQASLHLSNSYTEFVRRAATCMLRLLEEQNNSRVTLQQRQFSANNQEDNSHVSAQSQQPGFSARTYWLNTDRMPDEQKQLLAQCAIVKLVFDPGDSDCLISTHAPTGEFSNRGYVCVWSVAESRGRPRRVIGIHGSPSCCCSVALRSTTTSQAASLVTVGCHDGSLHLTDISDSSSEPTPVDYTTHHLTLGADKTSMQYYHHSRVVTIQAVPGDTKTDSDTADNTTQQLASLDTSGHMVFWTVVSAKIAAEADTPNQFMAAAPWARHKLTPLSYINTAENLPTANSLISAYDFCFSHTSRHRLFVALDNGAVAHCSRMTHERPRPSHLHVPPEQQGGGAITAVTACKHRALIASVGQCGTLSVHSEHQAAPLMQWHVQQALVHVHWLHERPCVLVTAAGGQQHNQLHVWDFAAGDMAPIEVYKPVNDVITSVVGVTSHNDLLASYLALSTGKQNIEVHQLADKYRSHSRDEIEDEMDKFIQYIQ